MNTLQNSAILASAGSGKTYTLTNRFIYLLNRFEQPERIIALTFTRTAAGEFFQKIVEKLCIASENEAAATTLSKELSIHANCTRYRYLLQLMVSNMHRLNLQTLDSFFFRIVSLFAIELGLFNNLELMDETSAERARNQARNDIVYHPGVLSHELNEFWHAFKQATYGKDARSVETTISRYTNHLYELFLNSPESEYWGQTEVIWPNGCPWKTKKSPDWDQLADVLIEALPDDLTKSQKNAFETAAENIRNYVKDEKINTLLSKAFTVAPDIFSGQASIKVRSEIKLGARLCDAVAECLRAIAWHHLHRSLNNTQGVYRILQAYHKHYDYTIRRKGQLAFSDLTHLLNSDSGHLHVRAIDLIKRQLMDFRLDGRFDHWLFDEFQDTSRQQWQVVANLIDEVIQDNSGQRSFFYVGDTKQCLYLWRNSDDRLFHDIQKQYNANSEARIVQQPLSISWRSAPPIIDAVNTVFDDQSVIAETFSPDAAIRWKRSWQMHRASPATKPLSGFACWLEAQKDDSPTRNELILQLLKDLNPIERELSVCVLVRKNADANEIADYLREHCALPIHNGSAIRPANDNAAGVALLALLQLAAHPGDMLARGYLNLVDTSTQNPALVHSAKFVRKQLFSEGYESAVQWAAEQIILHIPDNDTRHRERLQQLIDQARLFDKETHRDIDGLIHFLKTCSSIDPYSENTVVVETIHKSKGLEYDIVIFVNEDKFSHNETDISPMINENAQPVWILQPVKKDLMQADPKLRQLLDQTNSQRDFGNLCTLYVAMTRAKRGLYMISDLERPHKTSTVHFLKQVLGSESHAAQLFSSQKTENSASKVQSPKFAAQRSTDFSYPVLWSTGDPNWHESFKPSVDENPQKAKAAIQRFKPAHPRLELDRPSSQSPQLSSAARCFDIHQTSENFGTQAHNAFEQIEWFEKIPSNIDEAVKQTLLRCFELKAIRALFTKPTGKATVWREKAFSYVEGNQFINGIFDRVVLYPNTDGSFIHAEIIDFKTDRIHSDRTLEQAVEHHRPQLEAYRQSLAKILNIEASIVELKLLFTDIPQLVRL